MLSLKLPDRDSLGWLIPILLFCVFYGGFLWVNEAGLLRNMGVLFFIGGCVGLGFSRRVRRLIAYHTRPKTQERRMAFEGSVMMERAKRQARKEHIPELITHLYFDYIQNFPHWLADDAEEDQKIIPPTVTAAKKLPGNRLTITVSGREYIFTFVQYLFTNQEGEREAQATLQVAGVDQRLILIHLAPRVDGDATHLWPVSLEHVSMSDWINEFKQMQHFIDEEHQRRRHEDRMG
jgi:hypothetical protein